MQGIYTHIPETNYVPREYGVAAILLFLFMVLISLLSVLNLLYFYISTFGSMCAVPNMAVFRSYYYYSYSIVTNLFITKLFLLPCGEMSPSIVHSPDNSCMDMGYRWIKNCKS